jgi:hypothetical protein
MAASGRARTLLDRILERWLRRRHVAAWIAAAASLAGCATTSPRAKLDDAVQETNVAARFGRSDIAVERVLGESRDSFLKHHKAWGGDVRIVDVEFGAVEKMTDAEAVVLVAFGWFRPNEGQLHTTVVRQKWRAKGDSGWWLVDEERASGDEGLLGDQPPAKKGEPAKEPPRSRYETTTIPGE